MRLCEVVEAAAGGTGRHVIELSRGLVARGHELTLVYSPQRVDSQFDSARCTIGAEVVPLAIPRGVGWSDWRAARGLSRLLRERGRFDVIHGHSSKAGVVTRIADVAGAARVYTPHALKTLDPGLGAMTRSSIGLAERWLGGKRTDALIAVSAAEWDEAGRLGVARARRHLIPNRLASFRHRERGLVRAAMGGAEEQCWLGFIGRLCSQKAPLEFIAAAVAAMRRVPTVRAMIIGDGEYASMVEQAIAASGFADRFRWQRRDDARDWIAGLDLLVVTSRYEGLSYVMLEALGAGVPVLATPVGGAIELLSDGAGVVVEAEALPGVLLALLADRAWLMQLRSGAVRSAVAGGGEEMIDRTEAIYRQVARAA